MKTKSASETPKCLTQVINDCFTQKKTKKVVTEKPRKVEEWNLKNLNFAEMKISS